jgi:protein involved in polysaccharide export with SLBB domain
VTIEVKDYGSQKVEVLGQITKRGHQYLDGSRSLLEVINNAGGPKELNVVDVEHFCAETKQSTVYSLAEPDVLSSIFVADGDRVTLRPGRMVYVDGEVAKPGEVPYREGLTVTQALAMAGGPGEYASLRRAFILHGNGKKSLVNIYKINLGKDEDVLLAPDDRLLISRSAF